MSAAESLASFDGTRLAYRVEGEGPAVLLMHGFAATAERNWVGPGIFGALVATGRRVIAYDARGHGNSDKPHDPEAYAHGAMTRDAQAVLDHFDVSSVDVVGYSMGAINASRLVPREPRSRSLVLGGIGGRLLSDPLDRTRIAAALEARAGAVESDATGRSFREFAERSGNDLGALAALQKSRRYGAARRDAFAEIHVPTLVVAGADDRLAGSPADLGDAIPNAVAEVVPGDHLSAVGRRELTAAIVEFLARVSPVG
jgi:pimeloyl-ACP methyl ester carboxylesterase